MNLANVKGNIFDIQRFSIHDGPGIRTTVFMKGCPLKCAWCHNPESGESAPEIAFYESKCLYCKACANLCPLNLHTVDNDNHSFRREGCVRCGICSRACPAGALERIGRVVTVSEALEVVKKDEVFYEHSGGGMTLSGGEPFFQPEFALAILNLAKRDGLHTCVETSGAVAFEVLGEAVKYTDIFLYDIKDSDSLRHKEYTGISFEPILNNLEKLDAAGASIVLRCPVIPGINDNETHFAYICALAGRLKNVKQIDIEPYHPLGMSKAEAIGKPSRHADPALPPKDCIEGWVDFMRKHTSIPVSLL